MDQTAQGLSLFLPVSSQLRPDLRSRFEDTIDFGSNLNQLLVVKRTSNDLYCGRLIGEELRVIYPGRIYVSTYQLSQYD